MPPIDGTNGSYENEVQVLRQEKLELTRQAEQQQQQIDRQQQQIDRQQEQIDRQQQVIDRQKDVIVDLTRKIEELRNQLPKTLQRN